MIAADLLRKSETWLLDEGLAFTAEPGMTLASRLCWPTDFAMTCGVVIPVDVELIEEALLDGAAWLRHANPSQLADDPRFATALYRSAIEAGIMDNVVFRETAMAS